jgi:uncharacterized protein (DUF885 family)
MTRIEHGVCALLLAALAIGGWTPLAATEFSLEDWKSRVEAEEDINELAELYIEFLLESSPVFAMQIGIHGKEGAPRYHDRRLPDASAAGWARSYSAHVFVRDRLAAIETETLTPATQVDHHILANQIEYQILQMTRLGSMTNPLTYVGSLGNAFTGLVLRDYAPLEGRLESFGDRCRSTSSYLEQVRQVLLPPYVQPTAVQKQMAPARLRGMIREGGLFDKSLPELLEGSDLEESRVGSIREACAEAVSEIAAFVDWFEETMGPRPDGEWRLGREAYEAKYSLYMDYPLDPEELLAEAERALEEAHGELVSIARKIHDRYLADGIEAGDVEPAAKLTDPEVARNVFARLAEDRSTPETLIDDSYALADAIVGFVREKNVLDLPPTSKLRIEDIPPHMSGYAVAMITGAPPFEPELESVWFWDLALLGTAESYLKEYNRPTLATVYIHEGVPGHFVQLEYSNRFERIAPKVFRNGPMVEGWATYIATQLVDEGFTIYPDHPLGHELQRIVDRKLVLRAIINAIIDIRLHTSDWSGEEAVKLMIEKGFQEEGEAQGKLTRAKLSSVQLASYFAGHHAILELLDEYRELKGDDFSWKEFNERLVSAGSPPFYALREHMLSKGGAESPPSP